MMAGMQTRKTRARRPRAEAGVLTGWQQIADFFAVSISTVKRWHHHRRMPITRECAGAGHEGHPRLLLEDARGWLLGARER